MLTFAFAVGFLGTTLQIFPQFPHLHLPKPLGLSLERPVSGSFTASFCPAFGLRAGNEQQAEIYSKAFSLRGATGFCFGTAFFAQRARFSFRVPSLGFCCALPEDFFTIGFAVLSAEDLFSFFICNHFGSGLEPVEEFLLELIDEGVGELDAAHIIVSLDLGLKFRQRTQEVFFFRKYPCCELVHYVEALRFLIK